MSREAFADVVFHVLLAVLVLIILVAALNDNPKGRP